MAAPLLKIFSIPGYQISEGGYRIKEMLICTIMLINWGTFPKGTPLRAYSWVSWYAIIDG